MSYRGLLRQIVTVSRRAAAPLDGLNLEPESFAEVGEERCTLQAPKASSLRALAGVVDRPTLTGFFVQRANVRVEDRVTDSVSGRTFRVSSIEDAAGRGHHREALLVEIV